MSAHITILLPASFQAYTDGQRRFQVEAASVRAAVEALIEIAPNVRPHLVDDAGGIRPYINLFVDNQQLMDIDTEGVDLKDNAELLVVSAVAGG